MAPRDLQIQVSTSDGIPLFACTQSIVVNGSTPLMMPGDQMGLTMEIEVHHCDPELVKRAPHRQAIHQVDGSRVNEPDVWATTWRAHKRKAGAAVA